jgi:Rrf2 family nitric oxide-sensitive transcriptional repressor
MSSLLKISEAGVLGLHTVILLAASPGKYLSVHDMAQTLGASEHHLAKVLQRLAKVGLVASVRGPKGGFIAGKPLEDITLLNVFEAIEGPISPPACLLGLNECINGGCLLGDILRQFNTLLEQRLSSLTLEKFRGGFGKVDSASLA